MSVLMSTHFLVLQDPETQSSVKIIVKPPAANEEVEDSEDVRKQVTEAIQRAHDLVCFPLKS